MTVGIEPPRRRRASAVARVAIGLALVVGAVATEAAGAGEARAAAADDDWLGVVNTYRAMSGLDPVTANATWSSEALAHSCYMLRNGISHDEIPGKPGYTTGGDTAGNNGNVAVSSSPSATARNHVDLWMTGPFHAIGILRHNLTRSGFGKCVDTASPTVWQSGGTLDVLRGLVAKPRPTSPIVFPGRDATVPLDRFITETPNPMTLCRWSGEAGLPLIAMMTADVTSASATLSGPSGPIPTCVLHKGNAGADATARAILDSDDAVVVMPRQVLATGTYTATVETNAGRVTWSFTVDRDAPLAVTPPPTPDAEPTASSSRFDPVDPYRHVDSRLRLRAVRLRAGRIAEIAIGGRDVTAISANFVAVETGGHGFLTAYNCTTKVPTVATLAYGPGQIVPNQATIPLHEGKLCLYSQADADIVIDVNGFYRAGPGGGFVPVSPKRLYDTRTAPATRLQAGRERVIKVAGVAGGAPAATGAVALNVTAVHPDQAGYLQVYPCDLTRAPEISSVNYTAREVRPNTVVTRVDADGEICLRSVAGTDVTIDYSGYFTDGGGFDFVPLSPVRLLDTRSPHPEINSVTSGGRLRAGRVARIRVAGVRGITADARAVSVNLTAADAKAGSFLTAYPCGARPHASNVNIVPWQPTASNGAMVMLSGAGELCIYTLADVHVIVDVTGVWH